MQNSSYHIYSASAGSGKTYTLTKAYLKIILADTSSANYREILAITFTNKAVNEMKERILGSLFEFGKVPLIDAAKPMFNAIAEELDISPEILQKRAKKSLKEILHNYAFFDVSTIDKFTYRLIRTFAKDLQLPQNFEVILDTSLLLNEAVARLVHKAGTNEELTKVLIDFALEKADDDKSWDVSLDIFDMGKELIFKEKHEKHLVHFLEKNIADFEILKKTLRKKIREFENTISETAKSALQLISENGLEFTDFKSSYFPKFMLDVSTLKAGINFDAAWKRDFENTTLYNKTLAEDKKATIDSLHARFNAQFSTIKEYLYAIAFLRNGYKNIVPLTVLNALQKEVQALEIERDEIPLSTFNTIISKEIKDQPVPFIYERLGEKYKHYFIDEFQDTSELQWTNLIPLIGNALESTDDKGNLGSLLLVGDAKQAIYRWRGGKAEQFLDLVTKTVNPFVVAPEIENLPANYRSYEEIIKFNNDFFTSTSSNLNNPAYSTLFQEGNRQEINHKKGGLVQLNFIEEGSEKENNELYCEEVIKTIRALLEKNYALSDICILVRDKKNGILLANFLSEQGIPIISSETLLLKNSDKVGFLIHLLNFSLNPENLEAAYAILYFLKGESDDLHSYLALNLKQLEKHLDQAFGFSLTKFRSLSVFDGFQQAIKAFALAEDEPAYITYLLDEILDVEYKKGSSATLFLDYWEKKKDSLSISAPQGMEAVQIMTIHKSKGLEFPVVIVPFANAHIYKEIKPKMWLPVPDEDFNGFKELLINKNKEVIQYSMYANNLYDIEQQHLELDAFNVLYVALTRAVKSLYVITEKKLESKSKKPNLEYYSGLFMHFLMDKGLWKEDQLIYNFGLLPAANLVSPKNNKQQSIPFPYSFKERASFKILAKSGMLWDTTIEAALVKGNTVHTILSFIHTHADITPCFDNLVSSGELNQSDVNALKQKIVTIIQHPKLAEFYAPDKIIKNEKDIIDKNGIILRPDRLVFEGDKVTIIDYKTGKRNISYKDQIDSYALALEAMNYTINKKIIVYINNEITPEFI